MCIRDRLGIVENGRGHYWCCNGAPNTGEEGTSFSTTAGKGSLKQPRYQPPFDQPHEEDVVANRQRTVKTCQRTAKTWGNYAEYTHESALVAEMLLTRTVARLAL